MFPKSYTYQRREPDLYKGKVELMEYKSNKLKNNDETKSSNPYTNINPYENDTKTHFNVQDWENNILVDSEKKRAPTVSHSIFESFRIPQDQRQE